MPLAQCAPQFGIGPSRHLGISSRYWLWVLALMFGITLLNYMDRWVGSAVAR